MNCPVLVVVLLILLSTILYQADCANFRTSIQAVSHMPKKEVISEGIRHGKKKKKNKFGPGRGKKHRRFHNSSVRRFVEKQYLVHNRTLELLGDEVQKILLNTRTFTIKLPYPDGNGTKLSVLGQANEPTNAIGETKLTEFFNSSSVIIGLKISKARTESPVSLAKDEYNYNSDMTTYKDETQINFGTALARLISAVSNLSVTHLNPATACDKWLDCKKNLEEIFLGPLPACPCSYPAEIFYEDKIWDIHLQRVYRWRDASNYIERLDIYKPGAEYCIRSLIADGSTSLAAQHCCYDSNRKLITRGSGAGNPNYVSPDVSRSLHDKIDILPWKLCKGDFTRYNQIRPPNNDNLCAENPKNDTYERQVKLAQFF